MLGNVVSDFPALADNKSISLINVLWFLIQFMFLTFNEITELQ